MNPAAAANPCASLGLAALPPLGTSQTRDYRARAIFELGKFDPQCGDTDVLCPFALALDEREWHVLAREAEALDDELLAAERELLTRPDLHPHLAIPRRIMRALATTDAPAVPGPRVTRYDFHPTAEGWRISEANTDVPGGFIEASGLPALHASLGCAAYMSDRLVTPPDPTERLVSAVLGRIAGPPRVALVHATAYTDDRQVMLWLARQLTSRGCKAVLVSPEQLLFGPKGVQSTGPDGARNIDAIIRFFPAEWLVNLPRRMDIGPFFRPMPPVVHMNPATALLTQSKRLPLLGSRMRTRMPTWDRLLPETRDPREVPTRDEAWILKPALGRVGDGVVIPGVSAGRDERRLRLMARAFPRHWIAQRRFRALPLSTPDGPRYPCLGVYVIDGAAAGIYARLAARPLIDHAAQDAAVFIAKPTSFVRSRFANVQPALPTSSRGL